MDCQEQGALHDVIRHYEMWRHRIVRELKVPFSITSSTIAQYSVGPFHSTSCDPTNALLRQSYCWTQTRWRYRAKGDPRFYYAPKGHTLETSHDTKPQPKKPPKRTVFPTLAELPNINLHQLYVEMKPESSGRNAFKRKWKRWRQSMRDQAKVVKGKEEAVKRIAEKERQREEHLKELQMEWELRKPYLTLPPSLLTYLKMASA